MHKKSCLLYSILTISNDNATTYELKLCLILKTRRNSEEPQQNPQFFYIYTRCCILRVCLPHQYASSVCHTNTKLDTLCNLLARL